MNNFIYHKIVPKCPNCNSSRTGYYIKYFGKNKNKLIADKLKVGEIVYPINSTILPPNNLYCEECGTEWCGSIKTLKITKDELDEIMEEKDITENLIFETRENNQYQGYLYLSEEPEQPKAAIKKRTKFTRLVDFFKPIVIKKKNKIKEQLIDEVNFFKQKRI